MTKNSSKEENSYSTIGFLEDYKEELKAMNKGNDPISGRIYLVTGVFKYFNGVSPLGSLSPSTVVKASFDYKH